MLVRRRQFVHLLGSSGLLLSCGDTTTPSPVAPDDSNEPWWLRGNFAPVDEFEALELAVEGELPTALNGLYLRNGPNPLSGESAHWFIGDGMVHGLRLDNGKASWYRARYVQTAVLGSAGEETEAVGPPGLTEHEANTSLVAHAGKIFCLEEIGLPYQISGEDLSTVGAYDFDGQLATAMTAHPKIDPISGEMLFFGYGVIDKSVTYHRVDAAGALVQSETIPLPAAVMMHDFQVTDTHVVMMDLPILFDIGLAIEGASLPFRWAPENGARLGVMPRSGTAEDVAWFDIDPCYIFHTFNAFNDPGDANVIHLDAIHYSDMWVEGATDFTSEGALWRYSIDLANAKVSTTQRDDQMLEFPRIDPRRQGHPHRYGYGMNIAIDADGQPNGGSALVKYDFDNDTSSKYELAEHLRSDEPLFVPASEDAAEDEGWLLAFELDRTTDTSSLIVLDASDPASGPIARVRLPRRVPHGFHGLWVPA